VDRVFTTPGKLENELHLTQQSGASKVKVPSADCFAVFLEEVITSIQARTYEGLREELLDDAFALDWMRRSAAGCKP
jgi:hypothetical protein